MNRKVSHRFILNVVVSGIMFFVAACAYAGNSRVDIPTRANFSTQEMQGFAFVVQLAKNGGKDKIYFTGNKKIACLNGATGRVIWSELGPGFESAGLGIGPIIAGSTLVYMAGGGFFTAYGLDIRTGKLKWKLERKSPALAAGPGDRVYLATQGGLGIIAVDAQDGKIIWHRRAVTVGGTLKHIVYSRGFLYTDSSAVWNARGGHITRKLSTEPNVVTTNHRQVFMSGDGLPLVAMNPRSGKVLWQAPNPLSHRKESASSIYLAASERYVAAAFYDDETFGRHEGLIRVYDATSGGLLWEKEIVTNEKLSFHTVSVDNKFVYVIESSRGGGTKITAFAVKSGQQIWSYSDPDGFLGPPVSISGEILFSNAGQYGSGAHATLYALNRETGTLRWKFSL
ncbi:MAG: PQQ-binding-like beta-propeller repeat protein [Terriglobia bacterium]